MSKIGPIIHHQTGHFLFLGCEFESLQLSRVKNKWQFSTMTCMGIAKWISYELVQIVVLVPGQPAIERWCMVKFIKEDLIVSGSIHANISARCQKD